MHYLEWKSSFLRGGEEGGSVILLKGILVNIIIRINNEIKDLEVKMRIENKMLQLIY